MKKKYKALMLDVDGTILPNKKGSRISEKVADSIAQATKKLHVGVVTARPMMIVLPIIKYLKLTSPCIVDGGAQIIDPVSLTILWEQPLIREDFITICKIAEKYNYKFKYSDGDMKEYVKGEIPAKVFDIIFLKLSLDEVDKLTESLMHIPTIAVHRIVSWHEGEILIKITHAASTKQHAILKVAEILRIDTRDMIGVGEGYNDFPLLMACGLKIAMGNAVSELKEIADYIAPGVDEDGVADVIEKFVLSS
jgi:HAD superfamily hydrolase (TIGR01484 family)